MAECSDALDRGTDNERINLLERDRPACRQRRRQRCRTVWFDADGTAPNKLMGTVRSNSLANLTAKLTPSASGYWTIRVSQTATLKPSVTVRKYVRVTTPTSYRPAAGSLNCPSWAPIKGNLSSHIYHMPWQRYYSRTKPEMCFATEAAAVKAGKRVVTQRFGVDPDDDVVDAVVVLGPSDADRNVSTTPPPIWAPFGAWST